MKRRETEANFKKVTADSTTTNIFARMIVHIQFFTDKDRQETDSRSTLTVYDPCLIFISSSHIKLNLKMHDSLQSFCY